MRFLVGDKLRIGTWIVTALTALSLWGIQFGPFTTQSYIIVPGLTTGKLMALLLAVITVLIVKHKV